MQKKQNCKGSSEKTDSQQDEEPKVTAKAAVKTQVRTQQTAGRRYSQIDAGERPAHRPPMGKTYRPRNWRTEARLRQPESNAGHFEKKLQERGKSPENR